MRFNGKRVIVTGANSGIGLETARRFIAEGAKVVGADIKSDYMEALVREAENAPGEFIYRICDVRSPEQIKSVVDAAVEAFGGLDIVINNAGIQTEVPLSRISDELYNNVMDINFKGIFYFCKHAAAVMKKSGGGAIVNTASVSGIYGVPMGSVYPASKAAVIGLTKSLGMELSHFKIRVNCVAPGIVNTNLLGDLNDQIRETFSRTIPLGRMAEPEDIAKAILFLASEDADYITGACLQVDGGYKPALYT